MNQAYATRDPKRARRLLENLARRLESAHPGAAGSLREGLEETLTVMRLDLPESLERVLSSTNLIENLFSRVRDTARRVKRWQGGTDDSEMDRGWRAGSRAPLPQNCRLIERCPSWLQRCALMMPQSIAHARVANAKTSRLNDYRAATQFQQRSGPLAISVPFRAMLELGGVAIAPLV